MKTWGYLLCTLIFFSCNTHSQKINGVSYVASKDATTQQQIDKLKEINPNYASVMPFGFVPNITTPELIYNTERQWFGEKAEGVKQYITLLQKNNINIMLKPQIWVWRGEFTGTIKMETEADWKKFESLYLKFILDFAQIAQEKQVAIFCIGTELEQFVTARPSFWKQLIIEVKKVYNGKLTYAANWDEYSKVPFWQELDYIGIDGYFPLTTTKTPTVAEAKEGWQKWKISLSQFSKQYNAPILFTEFGYRSVDFSGNKPWESSHFEGNINLEAQNNLYTAFFEEIYPASWFAGGFIWKWFIKHDEVGGVNDNQFTPQNKPVSTIINTYFSKN